VLDVARKKFLHDYFDQLHRDCRAPH